MSFRVGICFMASHYMNDSCLGISNDMIARAMRDCTKSQPSGKPPPPDDEQILCALATISGEVGGIGGVQLPRGTGGRLHFPQRNDIEDDLLPGVERIKRAGLAGEGAGNEGAMGPIHKSDHLAHSPVSAISPLRSSLPFRLLLFPLQWGGLLDLLPLNMLVEGNAVTA